MEFVSTGRLSKNSRIAICLFGDVSDYDKLEKGLKLLTYNIPEVNVDYFSHTYEQLSEDFIKKFNLQVKHLHSQPPTTYEPAIKAAISLCKVGLLKQRFEIASMFKYDAVVAVNASSEIRYTVLSSNQEIKNQTVYGFGYRMDTAVMQFRLDNLVWFSDSNTFDILSRTYVELSKNPLIALHEELHWHSYIKKHNINIIPLEYKAVTLDAKKRSLI